MNVALDTYSIAFIALMAVAGAALAAAALNLGVTGKTKVSALDQPPQVVNSIQVSLIALGVGLPVAYVLGSVSVLLGFLGIILGVLIAVVWRRAKMRKWRSDVMVDIQSMLTVLVVKMSGGGENLYGGFQQAVEDVRWRRLGPIIEEYVVSRAAAGTGFGECLGALARSRLLADVPVAESVFASLADLVNREVSARQIMESLEISDRTLSDIIENEAQQEADAAQIRYSAYIVAFLTTAMAAAVILIADTLGDVLLYTVPGNGTLIVVCLMVIYALFQADAAADTRPLKF